jgi:spermidine/putrescine transport system permease protein
MSGKLRFSLLPFFAGLIYLFLYLPMAVVVVYSLNASESIVHLQGFTLRRYVDLLGNQALLSALLHSVEVSLIAVILACFLGTTGALFLNRVQFRGKQVFRALAMLPYVLPGIIIGLAILVFVISLKLQLSMITVVLGHLTFTTTVVMMQVLGRLARLSRNLEYAAMDLGANPLKAFLFVTLPMIKRSIIGGALLAFTLSFDEIIITYFLTSTYNTLPIFLYGMLRFGLSPQVYAVSTVVLILSILLIVFTAKYTATEEEKLVT